MNKKTVLSAVMFFLLAAFPAINSAGAQEAAPDAAAPEYTLDFEGIYSRLGAAEDTASAMGVITDTCSECRTYDDYERLASDLKRMAEDPASKNRDVLYYGLGRIRIDQLSCLSKSSELEAGRLYLTKNDQYYREAVEYLERAYSETKSKNLAIDVNILRLSVLKEKLQSEKADAVFDAIVGQVAAFSPDPAANIRELERVSGELDRTGLGKYSAKLKVTYASKADPATARAVLDGIKAQADERFANYDMKNAGQLYDQYTQAAAAHFDKEEIGSRIIEIAEKYYEAGKCKEARQYYERYLKDYGDLKMADYANYRAALCLQCERDYAGAIDRMEAFVRDYRNSVWFDKAFESLSRLYYEKLAFQQAVDKLQYLVDNYYRKNTGDFAQVLIGLLYYRARQYDIATEKLGKIAPTSVYYNAAETLLNDMKEIKAKKTAPNYGSDIADTYKVWDPNAVIGVNIIPSRPPSGAITGGGAEEIAVTRADDGSIVIQAAPGSKIQFALQGLADEDKFNEYMNDKEDLSRLPKEMREEKEKDLLALHWSAEDGNFSDENEGAVKVWQAPLQPGSYKVTAKTDDFGLVRTPDRGNRKDDAKDLTVTVVVGE